MPRSFTPSQVPLFFASVAPNPKQLPTLFSRLTTPRIYLILTLTLNPTSPPSRLPTPEKNMHLSAAALLEELPGYVDRPIAAMQRLSETLKQVPALASIDSWDRGSGVDQPTNGSAEKCKRERARGVETRAAAAEGGGSLFVGGVAQS
jgi:hypothetical protein